LTSEHDAVKLDPELTKVWAAAAGTHRLGDPDVGETRSITVLLADAGDFMLLAVGVVAEYTKQSGVPGGGRHGLGATPWSLITLNGLNKTTDSTAISQTQQALHVQANQ
jgi:hypothetical protein